MKRVLEHLAQYTVLTEQDPCKALSSALAFHPDLIILDLCMPGKDGGDVASELRHSSALRNVPVVFLTGIANPEEASKCSGEDYTMLSKVSAADTLVDRIAGLLARESAAAATC
jgi:CheY-like chemotaxis protein